MPGEYAKHTKHTHVHCELHDTLQFPAGRCHHAEKNNSHVGVDMIPKDRSMLPLILSGFHNDDPGNAMKTFPRPPEVVT